MFLRLLLIVIATSSLSGCYHARLLTGSDFEGKGGLFGTPYPDNSKERRELARTTALFYLERARNKYPTEGGNVEPLRYFLNDGGLRPEDIGTTEEELKALSIFQLK